VFVAQIGDALRSGEPHDGRAPDYDDWSLNGDILFYYPLLDTAMELSSMGIRVNAETLLRQLTIRDCRHWADQPFHRALLDGELPQTAGGGIGQSRLCMFFLKKAHIGEVQASLWPESTRRVFEGAGVPLL
jgi:aspartate--ammonia ligase